MLKNFFKKFNKKDGLTGTDIVGAIGIIAVTVGVVVSIYINTTNKSKEEIRYSGATRIATQIVENIEAMTYEEAKSVIDVSYESNVSEDGTVLNDGSNGLAKGKYSVNVPSGYGASISYTQNEELDIIMDVTVDVTYKVSNKNKNITLYTVKERELLEKTNEPNMYLLDGYSDNSMSYYPIKLNDLNWIVTSDTDSAWYNYDSRRSCNMPIFNNRFKYR